MNIRKLPLLLTTLLGLAATAFAQTKTTEATVDRVTGQATVTLPDGSTAALTAGMKVPQGATITTGADGDVYLESHPGYVTAIKKNSTVAMEELSVTTTNGKVTEEKTMLDLKSGDLVAKLDPTKHAVNNYQVRTPKGVAAARGTVFTVQYNGGTYTIAVINGQVIVTPPGGGRVNAVKAGQALRRDDRHATREVERISDLQSKPGREELARQEGGRAEEFLQRADDLSQVLAIAVATVAVAAQDGIGGTTPAEAAEVAQAVFTAAPSVAAQAAALIAQSTKGQDNTAVVAAITAVVPASQQAAFSTSISTGTFTTPTVTPVTTTTTTTITPTTITPQPINPQTVSTSH